MSAALSAITMSRASVESQGGGGMLHVPMDFRGCQPHICGTASPSPCCNVPQLEVPHIFGIPGADNIKIDMEIKLPRMEIQLPAAPPPQPEPEMPKPTVKVRKQTTRLSGVFEYDRDMEPVYFQSFDCVGAPDFFTVKECLKIVEHAETQGFNIQRRNRLVNLQWTDITDPFFAKAIWHSCGLDTFFRNVAVDGLVASGINDVVRIYKFAPGCMFGRHTDQHVKRRDGQISKYSLRVYLNGKEESGFEGGLSAFHVPFRHEPVVIEPEQGLALLYPQGDACMQQEETEVLEGFKYVLRADILFRRPDPVFEP